MVTTNDPDHPRAELICKGKILDAVRFAPKLIRFVREPDDDSEQEQTLTLTRGDGGPLAPKLEPVETPGIEAKLTEAERGERYELAVTLAKGAELERSRAVLTLQTGVAESPTVTIPVYVMLSGRRPAGFTPGRVPESRKKVRDKAAGVPSG